MRVCMAPPGSWCALARDCAHAPARGVRGQQFPGLCLRRARGANGACAYTHHAESSGKVLLAQFLVVSVAMMMNLAWLVAPCLSRCLAFPTGLP